jgi:hypothetical protein
MEVEPFIIGVGKVRANRSPEGVVILLADHGEGKDRWRVMSSWNDRSP